MFRQNNSQPFTDLASFSLGLRQATTHVGTPPACWPVAVSTVEATLACARFFVKIISTERNMRQVAKH